LDNLQTGTAKAVARPMSFAQITCVFSCATHVGAANSIRALISTVTDFLPALVSILKKLIGY